jgi:hypothetical protein
MLLMSAQVVVQIVGAPIAACGEGMKNTWRELAEWTAGQLTARFGQAVRVEYLDLFDPACPSLAHQCSTAGSVGRQPTSDQRRQTLRSRYPKTIRGTNTSQCPRNG